MKDSSKPKAFRKSKQPSVEQLLAMQEFRATVKLLQADQSRNDINSVHKYKVCNTSPEVIA